MPVPASINDLSTVAGSNSPAGTETPTEGDNYIRSLSAFIAQLRDMLNGTGTVATITVTGASAFNGSTTIGDASSDTLTVNATTTFTADPAGRIAPIVYTPTVTNLANTSAGVANGPWKALRVGNVVHFSGSANFTIGSGSTLTRLRVSLPVASAFAAATDAAGTGISSLTSSSGMPGPAVYANTATSDLRIESTSGASAAGAVMTVWVTGSYEVI